MADANGSGLSTQDGQQLKDGSASLIGAAWSAIKGETSLETIDNIALGLDLLTIALHKLDLLATASQAALTVSVAKVRAADAIANLADVTSKFQSGDGSPATKVQLIKGLTQAVGAIGMYLEGLGAVLSVGSAADVATAGLVAEVGAGLNWAAAALTVGTVLGYKFTPDQIAIAEANGWNALTDALSFATLASV